MAGDAASIFATALLAVTLAPGASFHVPSRDIHLSDVASVSPRQFAGFNPIIARLPSGQHRLVLTRAELGDLIKRAIPDATIAGATQESVTLLSSQPAPRDTETCFTLSVHKSRGAVITRDAVEPAACRSGEARAAVRLDADLGAAVASEELEPGAYLGQLWLGPAPAITRGQKVTIGGATGQVRVQRTVMALQSARTSAERLFVRDSDGDVFATNMSAAGHQ